MTRLPQQGPRALTAALSLLALALALAAPARAEEAQPPAETPAGRVTETLERLILELQEVEGRLAEVRAAWPTATEEERGALTEEIEGLGGRQAQLERDLEKIVTGIDPSLLGADAEPALSLEEEARRLLSPLLTEFKEATKRSRQINELRLDGLRLEEQMKLVRRGIENVERRLAEVEDERTKARLEALLAAWKGRAQRLRSDLDVTRVQLESHLSEKQGMFETAQESVKLFFRTRGLNLLLSIVAAALVSLLLRLSYRVVCRIFRLDAREERPFYARLLNVIFFILTGVGAVAAMLVTLTLLGDWVLVSLFSLVIAAFLWTARQQVPRAWGQIRMLLNLGTVRENERVIYEGVPWRVTTLGLAAVLENPAFAGVVLRLPLDELVGRISRLPGPDEPWFPSAVGDTVSLADGTAGRVLSQSHECVQLLTLGSRKTYSTGDYLAQAPANLSSGFWVRSTFGIGYAHQAEATKEIPARLAEHLREALSAEPYGAFVESVEVEFQAAGASSLDLELEVRFAGGAAAFAHSVDNALQAHAVAAATREGWEIPFPQLVVHRSTGTEA